MRPYADVKAEVEGLPWQKREAIFEAVAEGKAVDDEDMALLAAEWAEATRSRLVRIYGYVLLPLVIVTLAVVLWLVTRNDPEASAGGAVFAFVFALLVMGLLVWALAWRPSIRAEKANRAVAGLGPPPTAREAGHWVLAWLIAWPIAAVVGAGIRALGSDVLAGPTGIVVWLALVYGVKKALDSRS